MSLFAEFWGVVKTLIFRLHKSEKHPSNAEATPDTRKTESLKQPFWGNWGLRNVGIFISIAIAVIGWRKIKDL